MVGTQDFQQRLFEKIRADIGALMSEDDIKALVAKAFEKTFFTETVKTVERRGGYGHDTVRVPPEIVTITKELLEPTLKKALQDWLNEHEAEIVKMMRATFEDGLLESVQRIITNRTDGVMRDMTLSLQSKLFDMGSKLGQKGII